MDFLPSAVLQGQRGRFVSEGGRGGGWRKAGGGEEAKRLDDGVEESRRRKTRKGSHKSDEPQR
jgi:hypothetical protein